jgi:GTP-binding protein
MYAPQEVPVAPISSKPWFVIATKADKTETKDNYAALKAYLELLNQGVEEHPSRKPNAWRRGVKALPTSAINAHGVDAIPRLVIELLG